MIEENKFKIGEYIYIDIAFEVQSIDYDQETKDWVYTIRRPFVKTKNQNLFGGRKIEQIAKVPEANLIIASNPHHQ